MEIMYQTQQKPYYENRRNPYHPQGQFRSQPHKYESFGQNKNQGSREMAGPTSHYDRRGGLFKSRLDNYAARHIINLEAEISMEAIKFTVANSTLLE
ncbi:hypothetical protein NPIL_187531 [Nephila pilipes]|uniref:Uncharacterized protein n=1 Tax=Nephila pilipes TaxID=299642 RepID=A0A8X6TGG4_NEPPI|nr:hypothetical protein NPIL_187531 [Nephila pilipes]